MIKSAPYYWLECDACGKRAEYDEFSALASTSEAIELAVDADWTTDGMRHNCPTCPALFRCEECGKPAGDLAGERDYHCPPCWETAQADVVTAEEMHAL